MATQTTHLRSETTAMAPHASLYARDFWAITRHELIGGAADQLLAPSAAGAVQEILAPLGLVGLVDVAGWADTVKRRRPDPENDDPETLAFLTDSRNTGNDRWHYVDLPLGADGYDAARYATFTRPDDVVAITSECIRVLLGESQRFSPVNALRLVAHLIGDLHQPTHVGCGYLKAAGDSAALVRDPEEAAGEGVESDHGGNRLFLPVGGGKVKLHEYWDGALGSGDPAGLDTGAGSMAADVPEREPPARAWFIGKLVSLVTESADAAGAGTAPDTTAIALDRLPETWATESLVAARAAYESLRISGRQGQSAYNVTWEGQAAYDARCKPIVAQRLAAASRNLAMLVNTLWA